MKKFLMVCALFILSSAAFALEPYVNIGVNAARFNLEPTQQLSSVSTDSHAGIVAGVGLRMTENFAVEANYRELGEGGGNGSLSGFDPNCACVVTFNGDANFKLKGVDLSALLNLNYGSFKPFIKAGIFLSHSMSQQSYSDSLGNSISFEDTLGSINGMAGVGVSYKFLSIELSRIFGVSVNPFTDVDVDVITISLKIPLK